MQALKLDILPIPFVYYGWREHRMAIARSEAYALFEKQIDALKAQLPGISLGYTGNYERWGDNTQWYVFLPHPGRVGDYRDVFGLGPGKQVDIFHIALDNWSAIEPVIRKMYASRDRRTLNEMYAEAK